MERRSIHFSGRVQGVGFRYTAHRLAAGKAVTGYVRNLPDGRVEAVIEGEPPAIDALLAAIRQYFDDNIADVQTVVSPATGEFIGFEARR